MRNLLIALCALAGVHAGTDQAYTYEEFGDDWVNSFPTCKDGKE